MRPDENIELRKDLDNLKFLDANKVLVIDFD
jgi:hypothetical protein